MKKRMPPFAQSLRPLTDQQGITYLMVMLTIILIGISLAMVSQQWSVVVKRDQEAELWFRGNRVKEAIERFVADYEVLKATRPNRYPLTLKELVQKNSKGKRYLQMVYKDPMTGQDFELVKNHEGHIQGVRSSSKEEPFNKKRFEGAATYHAVRFEAKVVTPTSETSDMCRINPLLPTCQQQSSRSPNRNTNPNPES